MLWSLYNTLRLSILHYVNVAQDQHSSSASDSSVESGADAEDMQCSDTSDESDVAVKHEDSDSHGVSASVLASFIQRLLCTVL